MNLESIFVAREGELAHLQSFLDRALAGQGQVVFVTGEAGSGKTALVTEFARRAQAAYSDLIVAPGGRAMPRRALAMLICPSGRCWRC